MPAWAFVEHFVSSDVALHVPPPVPAPWTEHPTGAAFVPVEQY